MQVKATLFLAIFLGLNIAAIPAFAGTPPLGTVNVPELVERVDRGVVNIQSVTVMRQAVAPGFEDFLRFYGIPTERTRRSQSLGSGFVIDGEGYILTNNHVIENATEVEVFFNDGQKTKLRARVIGKDKKTDLALLKVKNGAHLHPLNLGNSDKTKVGETVVAIGNPFGLSHTVTAGIISAKNRTIGAGPFDNFIQTDASINFGNSGGPLFNAEGEVIGINTAINAAGQGLGFAIPINQAKLLLPDLKKYGKVARPWLGVLTATTPYGLVVDRVAVNGPAYKAGLRSGDLILSINDTKIEDRTDAEKTVGHSVIGADVTVRVERPGRGSKALSLKIKLQAEPDLEGVPPGLI